MIQLKMYLQNLHNSENVVLLKPVLFFDHLELMFLWQLLHKLNIILHMLWTIEIRDVFCSGGGFLSVTQ